MHAWRLPCEPGGFDLITGIHDPVVAVDVPPANPLGVQSEVLATGGNRAPCVEVLTWAGGVARGPQWRGPTHIGVARPSLVVHVEDGNTTSTTPENLWKRSAHPCATRVQVFLVCFPGARTVDL